MIVVAILGFIPLTFGSLLAIGHFMGIGWEFGAILPMICLGFWYGWVTARCRRD